MGVSTIDQGFGIRNVLLTIKQPFNKKYATEGWNSNAEPFNATPSGTPSRTQPRETQNVRTDAIVKHANGMGMPSKYLDFPVLSLGSTATVTLNRAKRVKPQST